jgi:dynein heavy chain
MNTRAYKSLAYGPGLLHEGSVGHPTEFLIQARNELGENRKSGRDNFQVRVLKVGDNSEIPSTLTDKDNGTYSVKYEVTEECDAKIEILFEDDKGKMVHVRGSPYKSSFKAAAPANANNLTGPAMVKYISSGLEELHSFILESTKGAQTKDKNIQDVKTLISVKDYVDTVFAQTEEIILKLDCLEESLKMFQEHGIAKDSQVKQIKKLSDEFVNLRKLAKDIRKEITPMVQAEKEKTTNMIKKFEEDLKAYTTELKKRDFYQYKTGAQDSKARLALVGDELKQFDDRTVDLGYNANKFDNPDMIQNSIKSVEGIKQEIANMVVLWDFIQKMQETFEENMRSQWVKSNPTEMEDEIKNRFKTLKEMRCDKKCNAYQGVQEDIKKWLVFLPLITDLRDPAMRDRHWTALKNKVQKDFTVDDKLLLRDVYNLNLNKYQEDVEEITDQARQEAKMEKTLNKLEETWKDVTFEFSQHKNTDLKLIRLSEENFEMLEENQVAVTSMFSSRYLATFEDKCVYWQKSLAGIAEVVTVIAEVQRLWSFLENLFIGSEEVKKELPKESEKFVGIDKEVKVILKDGEQKKIAIIFCNQGNILKRLEDV